jgi:hypothetical protein
MPRTSKQATGDAGEEFVASSVPCPYCDRKLELLPKNYPLFDVQCSSCLFRAQVKTSKTPISGTIPGGGLKMKESARRLGILSPPIISVSNMKANKADERLVQFFPFIPESHTKKKPPLKDPKREHLKYRMFDYVRMNELPRFVLDAKKRWRPA